MIVGLAERCLHTAAVTNKIYRLRIEKVSNELQTSMFRWTLRLAYLDRIFWEESTAFIKLACSIKSGAVVMILPVLPLQDELKSWSEDRSFKFVNIMFHFVSLGILFVVTTGYGQLCFSHQNISIEEVDHDVSVVAVQTIFDPDNLYFSTVDRQFSRFDLPKKIECLKG